MLNCLAVALGGALGSVLRYLIGLIPLKEQTLFPIKNVHPGITALYIILNIAVGIGFVMVAEIFIKKYKSDGRKINSLGLAIS